MMKLKPHQARFLLWSYTTHIKFQKALVNRKLLELFVVKR
jgi:hypothetical protein